MNLLEILRRLLGAFNEGAVPGFIDFVKRILEAGGVNDTTEAQIVDWLMTNAGLTEERAKWLAVGTIAELRNPDNPGINEDAAGLA